MNILVIGESCIDVLNYGTCNRLCPEAPVPVFKLEESQKAYGMAGNVLNNLQSIEPNWSSKAVVPPTHPIKTRFIDSESNQMILRVDSQDNTERISFNDELIEDIKNSNAVIVSDYNKGFLLEEDLINISRICFSYNVPCFLDTKKEGGLWADLFTFIKINKKEFLNNKWKQWVEKSSNLANKVLITRGAEGCEFQGKLYKTEQVSIRDVTGAGDTFLAAFVIEYLRTKKPDISIDFAQECCRMVVQKVGTATPYESNLPKGRTG